MLTIPEKKNTEKTEMETCIDAYIRYLTEVQELSRMYVMTSRHELEKLFLFLSRKYGSIPPMKLSAVTSADVIQYMSKAGICKAKATVFGKLSKIKCFFRFAEAIGRIEKDPTRWLRGPRIDRLERLPGFLTPREVERFIHTCLSEPSNNYGLRDYTIVVLLYATGIRVSELIALTIDCVDLNQRLLKVRSGKSREERFVPLAPLACEALSRYLQVRLAKDSPSTALFLNRFGKPISNGITAKFMRHYSKKSGLKKQVTAQLLRHTCATHLLEYSHQKIETIAKWLGHSDLANTLIYTHISDREAHASVQAHPINKILRKYPPMKSRKLRKAV